MIQIIARYQVQPGKAATVLSLLKTVAAHTRQEPGNRRYDVYQKQGEGEENFILLDEQYYDQKALDAHRETDYFKQIVIGEIVPCLLSRTVDVREARS